MLSKKRQRSNNVDTEPTNISDHIFSADSKTYAVIDGASTPMLLGKLSETNHACLFRGELSLDLAESAPYLVELIENSVFSTWLIGYNFQKKCCIFIKSKIDFFDMRKHCRLLLKAKLPNDHFVYFRYYDPTILKTLAESLPDKISSILPTKKCIIFIDNKITSYSLNIEKTNNRIHFTKDEINKFQNKIIESIEKPKIFSHIKRKYTLENHEILQKTNDTLEVSKTLNLDYKNESIVVADILCISKMTIEEILNSSWFQRISLNKEISGSQKINTLFKEIK